MLIGAVAVDVPVAGSNSSACAVGLNAASVPPAMSTRPSSSVVAVVLLYEKTGRAPVTVVSPWTIPTRAVTVLVPDASDKY